MGCHCVLYGQWHIAGIRTIFTLEASFVCGPGLPVQVSFAACGLGMCVTLGYTHWVLSSVCTQVRHTTNQRKRVPSNCVPRNRGGKQSTDLCTGRREPRSLAPTPSLGFRVFRPLQAVKTTVEKVRDLSNLGSMLLSCGAGTLKTHMAGR